MVLDQFEQRLSVADDYNQSQLARALRHCDGEQLQCLLLVRDDDIPRLLLEGVCELGIVGENIAREVMHERNGGAGLSCLRKLGFGQCL